MQNEAQRSKIQSIEKVKYIEGTVKLTFKSGWERGNVMKHLKKQLQIIFQNAKLNSRLVTPNYMFFLCGWHSPKSLYPSLFLLFNIYLSFPSVTLSIDVYPEKKNHNISCL